MSNNKTSCQKCIHMQPQRMVKSTIQSLDLSPFEWCLQKNIEVTNLSPKFCNSFKPLKVLMKKEKQK